jgi:molybdopterin-containing oxidoreductase family iron-sulfur binding subunit
MTHETQNHEQGKLTALRERLSSLTGQNYWRSLGELADSDDFREHLEREFPRGASEWVGNDPVSRRNFLKLMGASLALAGVVGCTRQPDEKIYPYTNAPEDLIPGIPQYYATAMAMGGYATGLLVESHLGRPTKIEGNVDHPASLGATDLFAQGAILTFYDPERSQVVSNLGQTSEWETFTAALEEQLAAHAGNGGEGIRLLTETVTSPTLIAQVDALLETYPNVVWHQYEPLARDNARAGAIMAFGEPVETIYDLSAADVVLTLDADILMLGPGSLRYARQYADRRRIWEDDGENLNRLYSIEATFSVTGGTADHRLAATPREIEALTRLIAQGVGVNVAQMQGLELDERSTTWINGLLSDLNDNRGSCVVVAGDQQPPTVHALAHAINSRLGNVGNTVFYTDPVAASSTDGAVTQLESLQTLVSDMEAGNVDTLLIIGGNPVFTAPVDVAFAQALENVPFSVHMGIYHDETAALCTWHIPEMHFLEAWTDMRAFDGTITIVQPLIAPLFQSRTPAQVLAAMNGSPDMSSYQIVRNFWEANSPDDNIERFWQISLNDGLVADSALRTRELTATLDNLPEPPALLEVHEQANLMEVTFRPDYSVWDGRFVNNGWLQELPRPLTRLAWDNAALISPRTAIEMFDLGLDVNNLSPQDYEGLNASNGRMVEVTYSGNTLELPFWIVPGHPDNTITIHLGYGHTENVGTIGTNVGFNAYALRTSAALWSGPATVALTNRNHPLVTTQEHHAMEGRAIVRAGTIDQYREEPGFMGMMPQFPNHPDRALFQDLFPYEEGHSWGMAIDLNACIGCNACVIACQAENNIPIVGKGEVAMGREMHWLRLDRYFGGDLNNPVLYRQPMACVQCELAPCEIVCPVNATVHDHEGLNTMIYNRCVGTKYCSNNCPYKVRRFNFFQYQDETTPTFKLMRNPDVSVRSRGVMEKCTYCIQRIKVATINEKNTDTPLSDGAIQTACQQVCPTQAIVFGDLNDPESKVNKLKQSLINYGVLEELNFFPRTTYLGRLSNPNPEIGAVAGVNYPMGGEPYGTPHGDESHGEDAEAEGSGGGESSGEDY